MFRFLSAVWALTFTITFAGPGSITSVADAYPRMANGQATIEASSSRRGVPVGSIASGLISSIEEMLIRNGIGQAVTEERFHLSAEAIFGKTLKWSIFKWSESRAIGTVTQNCRRSV